MSDLVSAFRWVLLASILIAAGMVADLGVRRSFHLGLATVLAPIEPDTRERALRLRPADNARGNVVRRATRIRGCDEVSQLIGD